MIHRRAASQFQRFEPKITLDPAPSPEARIASMGRTNHVEPSARSTAALADQLGRFGLQ